MSAEQIAAKRAEMGLAVGRAPSLAGTIMGSFMFCAAEITALALIFMFRFDTLALLKKVD